MKWCCPVFKSWYENAEVRGFAFLVESNNVGKPEFILQYKSVDDKAVDKLPVSDFPITLTGQIRIIYCPSCGKNLEKIYKKQVGDLSRPNLKISYD